MSEQSKINYDELKLSEEIARKEEEVPETYILKDNIIISPPFHTSPTLWEETLLINYSDLISAHPNQLAKLHYALKNWGCFQVKNHGMTSLLEEMLDITTQFFALPEEEKTKSSMPGQFFGGYGNAINMYNDTQNWYNQLFLSIYPEDQRQLQIWPQNPPKFREVVEEYALKIVKISEDILKAMAKSLGLKEDSFLKKHGERGRINTKFSYYPPCSRPDRVFGARPHTDPSTLTILLPDDKVEGLHIQKDDHWYNVPLNTGALFINLGDAAEVMSNGIFKSVLHRVVTNRKKERVSIAAFFMPGSNGEIGPIDELITTTQTQVYKKVDLPTYRKLILQNIGPDTKLLNALKL